MTPPPSHGEHIARMIAKGESPFERGWYERFRSWLQGYAWKGYCKHRWIKYCPGCDKGICRKCHTRFPREYTMVRAPQGPTEVIPCNHD